MNMEHDTVLLEVEVVNETVDLREIYNLPDEQKYIICPLIYLISPLSKKKGA